MAKKFYQTTEFLEDKAKWDKLLDAEGLGDDEIAGRGSKVVRPQVFSSKKSKYRGGADYFELCREILHSYRFERDIDREIFEQHMFGLSARQIEDWLRERSYRPLGYRRIHQIVQKVLKDYLNGSKGHGE